MEICALHYDYLYPTLYYFLLNNYGSFGCGDVVGVAVGGGRWVVDVDRGVAGSLVASRAYLVSVASFKS